MKSLSELFSLQEDMLGFKAHNIWAQNVISWIHIVQNVQSHRRQTFYPIFNRNLVEFANYAPFHPFFSESKLCFAKSLTNKRTLTENLKTLC